MADQGIVAILEQRAQARSDQDPLAVGIVQAGTSLKFATLALRSCYVANSASIEEFTSFRADVTTKAAVYKEKVLPLAKMSLQKVKDFVIYFQDLSYDDCLEIAEDIAIEAKSNQALMELNRDTHKAMTVEFNMLADKVETVLKKCELEAEEHRQNMESLQASASTKEKWAVGLAFIPGVGAIATPLLAYSAQNSRVEAIAEEEEAKIAVGAATVVKECLHGALKEYCFAMEQCAGEFQKIASDCESFAGQAEKFGDTQKRQFHKLMQKRADNILGAVQTFQVVCVAAETDLECLPATPEPNYVRQWLDSKKQGKGPTFLTRLKELIPEVKKQMPQLLES